MADLLTIITQVSSTTTLVFIGIALFASIAALKKLKGGGKFEKSLLFHALFLSAFFVAVAVMSLYHWLHSELLEQAWYFFVNISLAFGIAAGIVSYKFWKAI